MNRTEVAAPLAFDDLRRTFPTLSRTVHGKPLVYLDSAATAQKPEAVIEAEARYYRHSNANVHRGLHTLASEATDAYEGCRERVAHWLGAKEPSSVIMTRGTTSSLNGIALGLEHTLRPGDEILLTEMEHHANLVPWIMLAKRRGVVLKHIPITDRGELDLSKLDTLIGPRTRVVSVTAVSNVVGTINPLRRIADAAHRVGATMVVDAAQAVGHLPLSLQDSGADLLVFSAHKVYGPMGLGFTVGRREVLERLEPAEGGGEMIGEVELDRATWAELPQRLEAGTPNVAAAAAFPPAIDLIETIGIDRVRAHEEELTGYALDRLAELDGLSVLGPLDAESRGGLVSFHDEHVHPHDMATILDSEGVAIRAGHHCAQPLHRRLGVVATTRASFGIYNNREDVDRLVEAIASARRFFG